MALDGDLGDTKRDMGRSRKSDRYLPASSLDLNNPRVVSDLFEAAAKANYDSTLRRGSLVQLPSHGRVLMTGDIHDNIINLQKILQLAALEGNHNRHVIIHEVVHGKNYVNGMDMSVRMLARVAALKLQHPGQVHILQANHELAQLRGEGILKDGVSVVEAFDEGLEYLYGEKSDLVRDAMDEFIRSFLMRVRCDNGLFFCHSIPSPHKLTRFDVKIIDRVPTEEDLNPDGSAYVMVWGRNHTQDISDHLSYAWDCKIFVMGHQPAEMGYDIESNSMLVLNSDHDHAMVLPIDLSQRYTMTKLVDTLVPLAGVIL